MKFFVASVLALCASTSLAWADDPDPCQAADAANNPDCKKEEDGHPFSHWGVGPAITYDVFNRAEVSNVTVDSGGIVRGDAESNADVGLVFELHYMVQRDRLVPFGASGTGLCGGGSICGSGPFIAVQAGGSDQIIESMGGGWMWGFRRDGDDARVWGASQFNIGIGVMVDPSNEVLDTGFNLNQPLPMGETAARTHTDAQADFILLLSVTP